MLPLELTPLAMPESTQSIWERIFPEWFSTSGYEHADGPEQERLCRRDDAKFVVEAWVPIVKSGRP